MPRPIGAQQAATPRRIGKHSPGVSTARAESLMWPWAVNFTAFPIKLTNTWKRREESACVAPSLSVPNIVSLRTKRAVPAVIIA
eukprot:1730403-Rhodomonas_salina.1